MRIAVSLGPASHILPRADWADKPKTTFAHNTKKIEKQPSQLLSHQNLKLAIIIKLFVQPESNELPSMLLFSKLDDFLEFQPYHQT